MQLQSSIESHLQELELSLMQPAVRSSPLLSELLAEDFVEFGSSGRTFTKEQIVASLQAESGTHRTATQFKVQLLAPQTALVTYRACRHAQPPVHTLRSSIWQHRQGRWQMVFHQGTPSAEAA